MSRACTAGVLAALATSLAAAAPAAAVPLLSTTVSAPAAAARDCHARLLDGGTGYGQKSMTLPTAGLVAPGSTRPAASGTSRSSTGSRPHRRRLGGVRRDRARRGLRWRRPRARRPGVPPLRLRREREPGRVLGARARRLERPARLARARGDADAGLQDAAQHAGSTSPSTAARASSRSWASRERDRDRPGRKWRRQEPGCRRLPGSQPGDELAERPGRCTPPARGHYILSRR
jgi:hypothetical protein